MPRGSIRPSIRVLLILLAFALAPGSVHRAHADARPREVANAAELRLALHKLRVLGSVLYISAHPDDENTTLLAYLSKGRLLRTGYLSLTRGDGGQNLIGTEFGEQLGVIRTQELLAARRVDGAEQYFTRAIDFGFSKGPDETLRIWGHDPVLADVVWTIRKFRPDVILTRFPTDGRGGHGHHTASAILAEEAFQAAADSTRFPEQLAYVRPWQAKRILWNVSGVNPAKLDRALDTCLTADIGTYNALLGRSYGEIAAESRSMHKTQGFGAAERRGPNINYFMRRGGDRSGDDILSGVVLDWSRVRGGAKVDAALADAERRFDPEHPADVIPALCRAHAALAGLGDDAWVATKRRELEDVIRSCAGLWLEAIASAPSATPGGNLKVTVTALDRSRAGVTLDRIELPYGAAIDSLAGRGLADNRPVGGQAIVAIPADAAYTPPYWLAKRPGKGLYEVDDQALIGVAENPPALVARVALKVADEPMTFAIPVVYRWTDPVQGERYRPFNIVPPVSVEFDQAVYVFPDAQPREVRIIARSGDVGFAGAVRVRLPAGWRSAPDSVAITLAGGAETIARFTVTPGPGAPALTIGAVAESNGRSYAQRLVTIDHPHIPVQVLLPPAEARLVRTDIAHVGRETGYLMGSGDAVPEALRQIGYHVTLLSDDDLQSADLARYECIVVGVRAYNTRPRLVALEPRLLDYVNRGGTLVVQYNTADDALKDKLGPYPFTISRDRVTDEDAQVRFIAPRHPLLLKPNPITARDFEGWVQERGLNFASPWDTTRYETVLGCHDAGEPERAGGLLYARYGKGVFIYTGYAWFRQLPAGVPGAYRLFANLISARAK